MKILDYDYYQWYISYIIWNIYKDYYKSNLVQRALYPLPSSMTEFDWVLHIHYTHGKCWMHMMCFPWVKCAEVILAYTLGWRGFSIILLTGDKNEVQCGILYAPSWHEIVISSTNAVMKDSLLHLTTHMICVRELQMSNHRLMVDWSGIMISNTGECMDRIKKRRSGMLSLASRTFSLLIRLVSLLITLLWTEEKANGVGNNSLTYWLCFTKSSQPTIKQADQRCLQAMGCNVIKWFLGITMIPVLVGNIIKKFIRTK